MSHTRKLKSKKTNTTPNYVDELVRGLMQIARHSPERLKEITKDQFYSRVVLPSKRLPITFTELKKRALYELEQIGFCYPSIGHSTKGTYIVVGDCHGKHTRTGMFKLLQNLSNHIHANKIIHVGHMIDDDNDINFNWSKLTTPVSIIAKEEELKFLAKSPLLKSKTIDILSQGIELGKLSVQNQDLIGDYVQSPIGSAILPDYFKDSTIVNCHRHEMEPRCTPSDTTSFIASPGCMCEPHIVYTIKQQDFCDGRTVKLTFPTGYKKYRRMRHMSKTWQQGIIVVHVDENGDFDIIGCRIHMSSHGYTTSYFDKIITEDAILNPDVKTIVNADMHSDMHDMNILDIQEQIANDYHPDVYINIGDINGNEGLNHHRFSAANSMRFPEDTLKASAVSNYLITKLVKWAKRSIIVLGNHERFYEDMIMRLPQLKSLFDFKFLNGLTDKNIEILGLKSVTKINGTNYTHGDVKMFGQKGSNYLDKLYRTYGKNTACGHCHYPSYRHDCYTIGLTGQLDLNYNETSASKWVHGLLLDNKFEDQNFLTTLSIVNNRISINGTTYKPKNTQSWIMPKYKAKIVYEYENKT